MDFDSHLDMSKRTMLNYTQNCKRDEIFHQHRFLNELYQSRYSTTTTIDVHLDVWKIHNRNLSNQVQCGGALNEEYSTKNRHIKFHILSFDGSAKKNSASIRFEVRLKCLLFAALSVFCCCCCCYIFITSKTPQHKQMELKITKQRQSNSSCALSMFITQYRQNCC